MLPLADDDRAVQEQGMDRVQVQTTTATPSVGPGAEAGGTDIMEEDIHSRENNMGSSEMVEGAGHSTEIVE